MKQLVILGSTGSIGTQALDVIRAFPDFFELKGISGFSNMDLLAKQVNEFKPSYVAVSTDNKRRELQDQLAYSPTIFVGDSGLLELVDVGMDMLLVAIVGQRHCPGVAAISKVKHIAIANKKSWLLPANYGYGWAIIHG